MSVVVISLLAFVAGGLLGYFLLRSGILGHARIVELEQALAASEAERAEYKQQVTAEFTDTAEKFRALNRSYEDLHRQLAKSANALCGEAGAPTLIDYSGASSLPEQPAHATDSGRASVDVSAQHVEATADLTAAGVNDHNQDAIETSSEADNIAAPADAKDREQKIDQTHA